MTYYILLKTNTDEIINGYGICQTEEKTNAREIIKAMKVTHPEYEYYISEMVSRDAP